MVSTGLTRPASAQTEAGYVTRLALVGEEAGFDSVWCADRTVYPADLAALYPAQYGPESGGPDGQKVLEVMTTLAFLAGRTSRVTVGFCVMVLPFRNPVLNAKMVTTLDVLSGGRVIFGTGVGWMPEEFEALCADVEHMVISVVENGPDAASEAVTRFAEQVIPAV
jgi:alkanesulfonate monooxygenase SsuD/methylene tetrahydromethanopterin reductase-like flavin-dependent oxidoreductase (luciferase family)